MAGLILPTKGSDFVRGQSKQIPRVGEVGGLAMPAFATFARSFHTTGTLVNVANVAYAISDCVVMQQIIKNWTASAVGGITEFTLSPPSTWKIASINFSSIDLGDGMPKRMAMYQNAMMYVENTTLNEHQINLWLALVKE